jgi:hypothetical protein
MADPLRDWLNLPADEQRRIAKRWNACVSNEGETVVRGVAELLTRYYPEFRDQCVIEYIGSHGGEWVIYVHFLYSAPPMIRELWPPDGEWDGFIGFRVIPNNACGCKVHDWDDHRGVVHRPHPATA